MAYQSKAVQIKDHSIRNQIDQFFASIGRGFNAYLEAHSHAREIEALSAKSDDELAAMGISRGQIVRFAFRGQFYC